MIIIWMQTTTAILLVFQRKIKTKKLSLVNQSITAHLTELFLPPLNWFCVIKSGEIDTLNSALSELQNIKSELVRIINIAINKG